MTAITGCYRRAGTRIGLDETLARLHDRLGHRGADGGEKWSNGSVGFGHQQLHTTPESLAATLPTTVDGLTITADARIDNREELFEALEVELDSPRSQERIPDSRLLLEAYREWGVTCPTRLLGAFAFAVWDHDRESLFCARDHVGVKPLYYHCTDDLFAFASELPALRTVTPTELTPDERWIGDYLAGRLDDRTATGFEELERLPPAHTITITEADRTLRRYWSLEDIDPLPPVDDDTYERQFRDLFTDAVDVRLRGQRPECVGSLLSGGLDSGSIASVAATLRTHRGEPPLPTFSAVFEDVTDCDEREFIDAVTDAGGVESHTVHGDQFGPLADAETLLEHFGRPFYPSLFLLIPRLYAAAADEGVRTILHGYGGDQTMGSSVQGYFRGLARRGQFPTLARELRAYRRRYPWLSTVDVLWRDVLAPLAPQSVRRFRHSRFETDRYVERSMASIDRQFARRTGLDTRLETDAVCQPPQSQRELRRQALAAGEPSFNLELNDAAAAAVGIEPRYPYFDKRLIEFSLALPPGATVTNALDRTIVRDGLAGVLPRAIRERDDKMEFSPNVVHGTTTYDLETIERTLFDGTPTAETFLDVSDLEAGFERLQTDTGTASDARNLSMATTLEWWLSESV
ncbi:asparagine synthase-related protein [Halobacteria archaeon AArc-m2/3/4]|uniref:Putative asparagine synthetase [glutamine-hydrolyzing] n=1 Tax=Natronoglomus mannanivorans TaxID=2979990 RepID=A0ABT2QIW6_9EURY|nr:asparagine synthase-related protein [Halobacteria archaeon AArc-m2/3/4]